MSALCQKRTYERHLPLPVDKPSATSSPLIAASGDARLGAVSPDALLVSGPGELMSEHAPSRQGSLRQPGFAQAVFISGEVFRLVKRDHPLNCGDP